jgi:hypothetical protein
MFLATIQLLVFSQNDLEKMNDLGRISIFPVLDEMPEVPKSCKKLLLNKMKLAASKNGLASFNNRFIMYASLIVVSENVTSTMPVMNTVEVDLNLYIADNNTSTVFSSITANLRGVGKTKEKAYLMAIKSLNYNVHDLELLINTGKDRIITYYNTECDFVIKKSESLSSIKRYDEAIANIGSIPKICKDCYSKGQNLVILIFNNKMENDCAQNINNARVAKAQDNYDLAASYLSNILPDVSCYNNAQKILKEIEGHRCSISLGEAQGAWASGNVSKASESLSKISTDSKCYKDALVLISSIKNKLDDQAKKDFEHTILQEEQKLLILQEEQKVRIEEQRIRAIRDIYVSYSQQQVTPDLSWLK